MKHTLLTLSIALVPLTALPQMQWVLNGTTPLTLVLSGGTAAHPIYMEVNNPSSAAITTIGSKGWIVSESEFNMVKWDIGNGAGTYVIPFGHGTSEYLPLSVALNHGSAVGSILFSTWHTPADNDVNRPSDVTNMAAYNMAGQPSNSDNSWNAVDRFWVMDASSYVAKPAATNIEFTYISATGAPSEVAAPNVFAESNLLAQRFNTAVGMGWGDWLGMGGTDIITGTTATVNSGNVASADFFRSWTLSNQNSPLPIQISSFTDQCDNGTALIQWISQSELNNDFYTVKKTMDNLHFETVGKVKGAGTTSLPSDYSLVDNSPYGGTSYYYLYQTDFDGNSTEVGVIPFTGCGSQNITTINGYNTTNYIEIDINSVSADNYDISLVNMLGQTLVDETRAVATGNNEFRLENTVSHGIYILNVKNDKINYSKKLVL